MTSISRPVALVTGAARSIGRAVAERLHADGFTVALTDIDVDEAQLVARALAPDARTARAWQLDVCSLADVSRVFDDIQREFGAITALVNNAGVYPSNPALTMSEHEWDRVLDTNLKGTFFCCQAMVRRLVDAGGISGAIVNMASTAAFSARPGAAHYGASKAATVMLTKSLAQEWGSENVRVNAVAPGLVEVREGMVTEEYKAQFLSHVPSGRIGHVTDIAGAVSWLLGSEASYVNGHCLTVDGGFLTGRTLRRSGD